MCDTKIREGFLFPGGIRRRILSVGGHSSVDNSGRGSLGDPGRAVGVLVCFRELELFHCCLQWRTSVGEEGVAVGLRLSLLGAFLDARCALLSLSATARATALGLLYRAGGGQDTQNKVQSNSLATKTNHCSQAGHIHLPTRPRAWSYHTICPACEQWLVFVARELDHLDCTLFCVSRALRASPCLFRIDGNTRTSHDSEHTPHAAVERHALPQLGCVTMYHVSDDAVRRHPPTPASASAQLMMSWRSTAM